MSREMLLSIADEIDHAANAGLEMRSQTCLVPLQSMIMWAMDIRLQAAGGYYTRGEIEKLAGLEEMREVEVISNTREQKEHQ